MNREASPIPQRRSSLWLRVAVGSVAGSGLILYGPARGEMGLAATGLMLLHLLLGLALGVLLLGVCVARFRTVGAPLTGALALCLGTGAMMAARAAGGDPLQGGALLLPLHILSGLAALFLWSLRSFAPSPSRSAPSRRRCPEAWVLGLALFLPITAGTAAYRYDPEEYYRALTATNAAQSGSPHFPAGLLIEGKRAFGPLPAPTDAAGASPVREGNSPRPAAYCGSAGCHESAYREWLSSAHAAAAEDPFYRATHADYAARAGADAARWCEGCHEPGVLLKGGGGERRMERRGETADPAVLPPRAAGVDCMTCHATTRVRDLTGNGRFVMTIPSEYPFADSERPALRWLHGFLIRLRPAPHRAAFLKPGLHDTAEFCASCHRASMNVSQNGYKFFAGADEYGAWRESPVSGNSIHGFYPPDAPRTCQQCHMRGSGEVPPVSHAFHGGNTALSALREDGIHLRATERFLQDGVVTLDLFALRRARPGEPYREEWVAPVEAAGAPLRPGESVVLDVVLRNRGAGHDFPGGSGDLRDVWVEVTARDGGGRLLLANGRPGPDGRPGPEAHTYGLVALDRQGRRIERGDLDRMVTTVAPFSPRVIPSGGVDLARYRLAVPRTRGPLRVTARLLHRRVNPTFAAWALGGQAPELPLTVIAQDTVALAVAHELARQPAPGTRHAERRDLLAARFYDYGVALLAQRDLARAARAMQRVGELMPGRPDGAFGLGRVYLEEGDLIAARDRFQAALHLSPGDLRARLFLGKTYRQMGQYERALSILRPLVEQAPRDRLLYFEIGQCHLLSGRFREAGEAFRRMLDLDPHDLAAHYNLMTCYRQLRRFAEARREEAIYRYLKEDEAARRIATEYLDAHPALARETQSTHEHRLSPVK